MTYRLSAYKEGGWGDYFVLYAVGKYRRLALGVMDSGSNSPDNMINCLWFFFAIRKCNDLDSGFVEIVDNVTCEQA